MNDTTAQLFDLVINSSQETKLEVVKSIALTLKRIEKLELLSLLTLDDKELINGTHKPAAMNERIMHIKPYENAARARAPPAQGGGASGRSLRSDTELECADTCDTIARFCHRCAGCDIKLCSRCNDKIKYCASCEKKNQQICTICNMHHTSGDVICFNCSMVLMDDEVRFKCYRRIALICHACGTRLFDAPREVYEERLCIYCDSLCY